MSAGDSHLSGDEGLRAAGELLRRARSADGSDELRDFIENAAVPVHSLDADGVIQWANRAELELLGYDAGEYVGRAIAEFHVDAAVARDIVDRLTRGETLRDREARLRAKDGAIKDVLISSNGCFRDGAFVHSRCFTRDVTESRVLDRARAAAADRAERLVEITTAIAGAVAEAEVFEALVDDVAVTVGASSAALWTLDDDGRTVRLARSFGDPNATGTRLVQLSLDAPGTSPALDAILRGEPVWIPSREALLRQYPQLGEAAAPGPHARVACLPLIARGRVLGALALTLEGTADDSEEEQGFLLLVGWYAGQALERLRLLAAERDSRKVADAVAAHVGILSRASRTFVTADFDLRTRVKAIAQEIGGAVGGAAAISLIGGDGKLFTAAVHHPVREAQYGLETLVETTRLRVGDPVTETVATTGEGALFPALDPRALAGGSTPAYRAFLERYPIYAMMCAPLRAGEAIIGAVTAMRVRRRETYTRQDLVFLEELADRAAPAIENSRLHTEQISVLSRAHQLHQFAKAVVSAEKVEDVFEAALDAIESGLGSTRGAILVCDEQGVMRFRAWRNLSAEYRKAVEGHSPWPPHAGAPEPVLVRDVESDPAMRPYLPLFHREGIRSLAFIPLLTRGRLVGKFMAYFADRHAYSRQEVELASAIAHHLASVTARFEAIAKLEETIRYNDLFAGVLAHDLRNPLGAIVTAAQLVLMRQAGRQGDESSKPLGRIIASGQRMFRMIDQLLDLTRARIGGGIQLELRQTNLSELCDQAIGELELAHPSWNIERKGVGDLNGAWDPDRLLQIVSNLVGNAGQHGVEGGPIRVRIDGRHPDAVTLEVRNDGSIPEDMMPSLFDPLRGAPRRRDYTRGLGLGLFIVKEIVEAHGGTVRVASDSDGTAFTVTLPRRAERSHARVLSPRAGFKPR